MRPASLVTLVVLLLPPAARAQAWDPAPFRSATPIPRDGLPPERSAFLAWLASALGSLTQEDAQRAQERLYTYISAIAKQRTGRFPQVTDTIALSLFRSAASIGVAGADQVARALNPHPERLPAAGTVPDFRLSLHPPLFTLASDDGSWGVCFPYYFMAAPAGRQRPSSGVLTELVVLSTLVAPDRGPSGSSQATILLAAASIADSAKHVTAWLTQFDLHPTSAPLEDPAGIWYESPPGDPMHRLAVIQRLPKRVLVAVFLGLDGTFESNRPHLFNVLATIRSGHCAA